MAVDTKNIYTWDTDIRVPFSALDDLELRYLTNLRWPTYVAFHRPTSPDWLPQAPDWARSIDQIIQSHFDQINPDADLELEQMFVHRMPQGVDTTGTIHRDWPMKNTWAAVLFLDGLDGLTFYGDYLPTTREHYVEFEKGRLVIFPSHIWHRVERVRADRLSVGALYTSRLLVPEYTDADPICTCGLSEIMPICDGAHADPKHAGKLDPRAESR